MFAVAASMQISTPAVNTPAYCCATQGRVHHARLLCQMRRAFVGHTGSLDAAHISVTLVQGNVTNVLAVDSTGVR